MDTSNAVILRTPTDGDTPTDDEIVETRACSRCGDPVSISRKMRDEMKKYGGVAAHAVCPEEAARRAELMRTFSVEVRIGLDIDPETDHRAPDTNEDVETLGWFRATAQGETLAEALPELARELQERWDKTTENVHLMDPAQA